MWWWAHHFRSRFYVPRPPFALKPVLAANKNDNNTIIMWYYAHNIILYMNESDLVKRSNKFALICVGWSSKLNIRKAKKKKINRAIFFNNHNNKNGSVLNVDYSFLKNILLEVVYGFPRMQIANVIKHDYQRKHVMTSSISKNE